MKNPDLRRLLALMGYLKYLAEELNANFTQVWAIRIFSGRTEAEFRF